MTDDIQATFSKCPEAIHTKTTSCKQDSGEGQSRDRGPGKGDYRYSDAIALACSCNFDTSIQLRLCCSPLPVPHAPYGPSPDFEPPSLPASFIPSGGNHHPSVTTSSRGSARRIFWSRRRMPSARWRFMPDHCWAGILIPIHQSGGTFHSSDIDIQW